MERILDMVRLSGFESRRPAQLSGGQQQRVAVARALVFEPALVLMDEPLGALDKNLREEMQYEIKRIHENLGVTVIYVTHDQSEALTMSSRIAVFNDGVIQQLATPDVLYEKPENAFVAQFIGENNRLRGTVASVEGTLLRGGAPGRCDRSRPDGQRGRQGGEDLPVAAPRAGRHRTERGRQRRQRPRGGVDISRETTSAPG